MAGKINMQKSAAQQNLYSTSRVFLTELKDLIEIRNSMINFNLIINNGKF